MTLNSDLQIRNIFSNTDCKRKYYKKASNRKMFGDGIDRGSTSSGVSNIKRTRVTSPYLNLAMVDKIQNRQFQRKKIAENRKLVQKSLHIHKANSDEISKSINVKKKVKKSVLTLPNSTKISDIAQVTVSDMNASEYDNEDTNNYNRKVKKRLHKFSRQTKTVEKDIYNYYDRDELYCTQLDFDVSRSSADLIKKVGYGKRITNNRRFKNNQSNKDSAPCNIWALLKNINPFPFRPSPVISEESIEEPKKKKCSKKLIKKGLGPKIYKTRQTEEFAYVSSVELNSTSPSFSRSSSFDRVTVIDNNNNKFDLQDSLHEKTLLGNTVSKSRFKYNNKPILQNKKGTVNDNYGNNNYCEHEHMKSPTKIIMNNKQQCYFKNETDKSYGNKCLSYSTKSLLWEDKTETYLSSWKDLRKCTEPKSSVRRVSETKTGKIDDKPKTYQDQNERKLRLVTTMPSSSITMTQPEIRRRLTLLKFPIIILGKDQVSSTFRVEHYTPVQYSGLDKHIWPFMRKWTENGGNINCQQNEKMLAKYNFISQQLFSNKYSSKSKSQNVNTELPITKRFGKCNVNNAKSRIPRFTIHDKVIDLLYKNSSESTVYIDEDNSSRRSTDGDINVQHSDINEFYKPNTANRGNAICVPKLNMYSNTNNLRKVWSKCKWSSDFINTVMEKINEGVYFNKQMSGTVNKIYKKHIDKGTDIPFISKDAFVQTKEKPININVPKNSFSVTTRKELREHSIPMDQFSHILRSIPGFDRPPTNLKIEYLREDQVAVKHCLANVLIEFDVSGEDKVDKNQEADALQIANNYSLPLTTTVNNVYKCKDIILNKKLPEQLCTLLPNIIGSIVKSLHTPVDSMDIFQNQSQLTNIPDALVKKNKLCFPLNTLQHSIQVNRNRCTDMVLYNEKSQYNKILKNLSLHALCDNTISKSCNDCNVNSKEKFPSAILKYTIDGVFSNKKGISQNTIIIDYTNMYNKDEYKSIIKKINFNFICSPGIIKCLNDIFLNTEIKSISDEISHIEPKPLCTSIVPYQPYDKKVNYSINKSNIERVITSFWNLISNNIPNIKVPNLAQSSLNLDLSLFDNSKKSNDKLIRIDLNTNESQNSTPSYKLSQSGFKEYSYEVKEISNTKNSSIRKLKTKTVRKYKISQRRSHKGKGKITTTTNVIRENSMISLNTINSIDDFFRIIGIKRSLLNIFDGQYAEKILTTLTLLRKWTEDITPSQALLIFVLMNKNESLNLVRFRSLILQGIAMNRITHVTELEMEIEVIEKENLNKWRQYEEIASLQPCVENNHNLLEELCWIAKTTAADHQKPFDENSKKLIKSLVAKRKTLNPTYLRLMSRYVGLGLLIPQGKYGIKPFKQTKIIVKD